MLPSLLVTAGVALAGLLLSMVPVPPLLSGMGADVWRIGILGVGTGAVAAGFYLILRNRRPTDLAMTGMKSGPRTR